MNSINKAKELIKLKYLLYKKEYTEYCIANPGYCMHNAGIKSMLCERILRYIENVNCVGEISHLIEGQLLLSEKLCKDMEGKQHGHYQAVLTYTELLEIVKEIEEHQFDNFKTK